MSAWGEHCAADPAGSCVCIYMYAFLCSRIQCVTAVQCSHVLLSLQIAVHWSLLLPA